MNIKKVSLIITILIMALTLSLPILAYFDFSRGVGFASYRLPIRIGKEEPSISSDNLWSSKYSNLCSAPKLMYEAGEPEMIVSGVLRQLERQFVLKLTDLGQELEVSPSAFTGEPVRFIDKFIHKDVALISCYKPFFASYILIFSVFSIISSFGVLLVLYLRMRRS